MGDDAIAVDAHGNDIDVKERDPAPQRGELVGGEEATVFVTNCFAHTLFLSQSATRIIPRAVSPQHAVGENRQLGAVGKVESGEHLVEVRLHGTLRHIELFGDLPVGMTVAKKAGDLPLARGE